MEKARTPSSSATTNRRRTTSSKSSRNSSGPKKKHEAKPATPLRHPVALTRLGQFFSYDRSRSANAWWWPLKLRRCEVHRGGRRRPWEVPDGGGRRSCASERNSRQASPLWLRRGTIPPVHFASLRRSPWTPSSSWTPSTPSRSGIFLGLWLLRMQRSGSEDLTQ